MVPKDNSFYWREELYPSTNDICKIQFPVEMKENTIPEE